MTDIFQNVPSSDFFRKLLRVLIVAGVVIVATALVTWRLNLLQQILLLVIAAPLGLLVVRLILQYPPLGFIGLILVTNLVSFDIWPMGLMSLIVLGLAGIWLLDMLVIKKEIKLIASPAFAPLLIFSAVVFLSFIFGQLPWFSVAQVEIGVQIAGILIFILSFLLFILVAQQVKELKWLKWMTFLFLITGMPAMILALQLFPNSFMISRSIYHPRTTGSIFWVWLVVIALSQSLFNRNLSMRWRVVLFLTVIGNFYLSLGMRRAWTSGWAPALVAAVALIWIARPRWAMPLTMIAGGVSIVMFEQIFNAVMIGDNEYSTVTRLEAWRIVLEIVEVNPVFGLGPGNYYNYTTLFPILGWYVEFNSHNNYVDIIAQTGILGLISYFWFFFVVARIGWRLRNRLPQGSFAQAYVFGALAGLVGTLVAGMFGDWVIPFYYNIGIFGLRSSLLSWLFMGGIVAIDQMVKMDKPME